MDHSLPTPPHLADPLRLTLLRTLFTMADVERGRRKRGPFRSPAGSPDSPESPGAPSPPAENGASRSAAHLRLAVADHLRDLDDDDLRRRHHDLARALLHEADRFLARDGSLPGPRIELGRFADASSIPVPPEFGSTSRSGLRTNGHGVVPASRVGLVSLPWMAPSMPSIQLATLGSALAEADIEFDVHELYVDYAARIGLNLYYLLDNMLSFLPEWVFSRHYYGPETGERSLQHVRRTSVGRAPLA